MKNLKQHGAAMLDYAMIVGLIALFAIGAVVRTGEKVEEVFCVATNSLASSSGRDLQPDCVYDPNDMITLEDGERFVDTPAMMKASFADVLFEKGETGERLVMTDVVGDAADRYYLDIDIVSNNEPDPVRTISACYMVAGGADPICSEEAQTALISVPPSAIAIGYLVTLGEDPDLPWDNDLSIVVAETETYLIEVSREEADPLEDPVSFNFDAYSYQMSDSGWTFGQFTPLEGKFNRTLTMTMAHVSGPSLTRQACYKATSESDPVCGSPQIGSGTAIVSLPAGSAEVGYSIHLPVEGPGEDLVMQEKFQIVVGGTEYSQTVNITRPNPDYQVGSAASFSASYSFAETDTGWTDGEFVALSGERNTDLTFSVSPSSSGYARKACYRLAGGEQTCGDAETNSKTAILGVPVDAVAVGYQIQLPAETVGPDTSKEYILYLVGGGEILVDQTQDVIRPNPDYQVGSAASFSASYSFAETDTGWTDGEFVALSGERNTDLTFTVSPSSIGFKRKACYRLAGGEQTCGDAAGSRNYSRVTVPVDAISVGYQVQLYDESVGPDYSYAYSLKLEGGGETLIDQTQDVIRPNPDYQVGSAASFSASYSFAETDTGWTDGEFVALSGERNTDLTFTVLPSSIGFKRKACYRLAGGEQTCGDAAGSRNYSRVTVPVDAISVGYQVQLYDESVGPDYSYAYSLKLEGGGETLIDQTQDVIRPNPAE